MFVHNNRTASEYTESELSDEIIMTHHEAEMEKRNGRIAPFCPFKPGVVKTPSVRLNIDKFRIEQVKKTGFFISVYNKQITLRRLRYLIESHEAETKHLYLLDTIENRYQMKKITAVNILFLVKFLMK